MFGGINSPKQNKEQDKSKSEARTKIAETFGTNPRLLRKQVEAERANDCYKTGHSKKSNIVTKKIVIS